MSDPVDDFFSQLARLARVLGHALLLLFHVHPRERAAPSPRAAAKPPRAPWE